jgi:hypothetical protein
VDNNVTFLAHYDEHTKDALRSIKPLGTDKALYLDGSVYMDTGLSNFVAAERDFTIEATLCPATTTLSDISGTEKMVLGWSGWHEGLVYNETSGLATFQVHFVSSDGTTTARDTVSASVAKGEWAHITCVYQMSPRKLFIYKDGVLANSLDVSTTRAGWTFKSYTSNAIIGRVGSNYRYTGNISEARIWSRALPQDEIVDNLSGNFRNASTLAGYWRMDEGQGTFINEGTGTLGDIVLPTGTSWTQGRPSYTLVTGGYPGGTGSGVFLEEGTSNLMSGKNITKDTYANISHGTDATGDYFIKSDNTTWYAGIRLPSLAMNGGDTYTWSFEIMSDVAFNITMDANVTTPTYSGNDAGRSSTTIPITRYDTPGQWKKICVIATIQPDAATPTISDAFCPGNDSTVLTHKVYHRNHQVEKKGYYTTYNSGTRPAPLLTYPITPVNANAGTISMWVNPQRLITAGNGYPMIFRVANNIFEWSIYSNKLSMNSIVITPSMDIQVGSWYFVVYKWNSTTPSSTLYLYHPSGVIQQLSSGAAIPSIAGQAQFFIGSGANNGAYPSNCIIDEVRIDNIARTDTEINAWYYQGRNGW